jgi:hypothetical protein
MGTVTMQSAFHPVGGIHRRLSRALAGRSARSHGRCYRNAVPCRVPEARTLLRSVIPPGRPLAHPRTACTRVLDSLALAPQAPSRSVVTPPRSIIAQVSALQ